MRCGCNDNCNIRVDLVGEPRMSILWRAVLTIVLLVIALVAVIMGIFSPMLADDPRNTWAAELALWICAAVFGISGLGIVATWWRMMPWRS
jgi:hypothetical protein